MGSVRCVTWEAAPWLNERVTGKERTRLPRVPLTWLQDLVSGLADLSKLHIPVPIPGILVTWGCVGSGAWGE